MSECKHCREFFARYRCAKHGYSPRMDGECDCPKCMGYCECRCDKCAGQITGPAIEDRGEGPEAGKVFFYCSDECRASH